MQIQPTGLKGKKRPYARGGELTLRLETSQQRDKTGDAHSRQTSLLVNSVYFFIETVFILETPDDYRLIAIHKGTLLKDTTYKTPKGAKIAFLKFFGDKAFETGVKPNWTPFFPPEAGAGPLKIYDDLKKQDLQDDVV